MGRIPTMTLLPQDRGANQRPTLRPSIRPEDSVSLITYHSGTNGQIAPD